jgi:GTPase SAR1 family protein
VFDLTRKETFVILQKFLTDIRQFAEPDCVIFLIGNKLDLVQGNENLRQVSSEEAKTFANENQLYYMETSACSNYKVTEAFETLIESKKYIFLISMLIYYILLNRGIQ